MLSKSEIKKFIPPIIFELRNKFNLRFRPAYLNTKDFTKWWNRFKLPALPYDLVLMMDYYITTPSFGETSYYWNFLSKRHIELLSQHKIDNFKQTIEKFHYWGEATVESVLIKPLLNDPVTIDVKTDEIFRSHEFCSKTDSIQHNIANIILLNYIVNNGYGKYLEVLEEPLFGNPIFIKYNQKRVSFPLLNSIIEIDVISKHLELKSKTRFLEIGAGSGRTALSLLKLITDSKYIIVDIPPALYISQENIIQNLPQKKIFKFQNFTNLEAVKDEFNKADIVFLSPEQLKLIPDKYVDVAIAIDCLHEMTNSDVEKYFEQFNRIASYFYFKCQNIQWAKTSKNLLTIDSYPVRSYWKKILHEKCYVPNDYFHAIYRM